MIHHCLRPFRYTLTLCFLLLPALSPLSLRAQIFSEGKVLLRSQQGDTLSVQVQRLRQQQWNRQRNNASALWKNTSHPAELVSPDARRMVGTAQNSIMNALTVEGGYTKDFWHLELKILTNGQYCCYYFGSREWEPVVAFWGQDHILYVKFCHWEQDVPEPVLKAGYLKIIF